MSMDLTALLNGQRDIHGRMSRSMDNLRKLGAGGINLAAIETRIRILDSLWTKFEVQYELICTCYKESYTESEYATEFFDTVENTYVQQRSKLFEQVERYKTAPSASATTTAQQSSDQSLKTSLPWIKLPQFSGAFEDWPSFRDFFLSVIGKNSSISNIERFHYLRSCLQGPAENLIRPLSVTGENYDRAWTLLKKHFENKKELIRSNFAAFTAVAKMKGETAEELSRIYHAVTTAVNAQESIGRPINTHGIDLFNHIVVELFDSRTRLEWESSTCDSSDPPSHDALLEFITKRMLTLKAAKPKNTAKVSGDSSRSAKTHFSRQGSDSSRCSLCSERHSLMQCSQFKAKSASERKAIVESSKLCFNCLGNHPVAKCQSSRNCWTCNARHHSMLHDAYASSQSIEISTLSAVSKADDRKAILLATARVIVKDRRGNSHSVRVLIDQGSEVSIISEALVQRLRLPRAHTTVSIIGIGNSHSGSTRGKVTVSISSNVTGNTFSAVAFILPRFSAYQGSSTKKITAPWSHIVGLPLADPHYFENDPVELLLGAEVCSTIFEEGLRRGRPQEPIAQKTTLGWILSGGCDATFLQHHRGSFTCSADHDLIKLVQRFWEQEQEPVAPVRLTPEEEKCEDLFVSSHTCTQAGRYVVRLSFSTPTALTNTRKPAERLLTAMERKCRQDAGFGDLYRAFMREYEDLKHMELVNASPEQENEALCYLPHHGVLRESSVTTKLRVVFNSSQSAGSEKSLNQQLLTGANLLPALADVLLRWRRHRIALIADVEKMYRQILVHPADRDYQWILWRPDSNDVIREYRLNTVTYGLACAPFLAIRTLRQLADDEDARFPRGASTLRQDCYVDDIVTGADTVLDTTTLQEELRKLCMAGGFPLRKWASNCQEALHGIPQEHQLQKSSHSWEDESHGTLGLRWHPRSDHFSFAIHPPQFTKRRVLSETAGLFDPLGWLAPVVIRAKIFIQSAWLQGLEWDTSLPSADSLHWKLFFEELPILEHVRVDRWLKTGEGDANIEIHGFADASERGYAAAVYLRVQDNGSASLHLLAAKSKVAPVKQVSLPRLELCAAALLTGLTLHIRNTLSLSTAPMFLWSDSRVTLCWIEGHASRWKTYVANRVAHIQLSLPEAQWRHVPLRDNPADCASRGIAPSELINHPL